MNVNSVKAVCKEIIKALFKHFNNQTLQKIAAPETSAQRHDFLIAFFFVFTVMLCLLSKYC